MTFCEAPGAIELDHVELHQWDAVTDPEAFVARGVRIMSDGSLVIIDPQYPAVYHVPSGFQGLQKIGSRGEGPGEYRHPHDAVQWEASGGYVVVERGGHSLIFYGPEGHYQRDVQILTNINSIAMDDRYAYVASTIFRRISDQVPLLSRFDTATDTWETLLEFDPRVIGEAPFYHFPLTNPIVRVGLDGEVYLGFTETYRIWRVGDDGSVEEVVRGCIPDAVERRYRADRDATGMRMSAVLISDFAVLENGDIVVRVGLGDSEGRRPIQRFNRNGEEQETWLVPAESAPWGSVALHPVRPMEHHVTWRPTTGSTSVVEYRKPR